MKRLLHGLLGLAVLALVVFHVGGGWYFAGQIHADALAVRDDTPAPDATREAERVLGKQVRTVEYSSSVGTFPAWFVPGDDSTWAILTHGKGGEPSETLRAMRTTVALGMPSMAISYRNDSGLPEDPTGLYGYGSTEWRDLEGAVRYALDHGAKDVVLVGYSMGGAITAAFLDRSDLADAVSRVVLDSPMLDLGETVSFGASQRTLPAVGELPASLTWTAKQLASARYDVDWDALDYVGEPDWLDVPALVIHGDADLTVPLRTSIWLSRRHEDLVELVVFQDAGHVRAWDEEPKRYARELRAFLS
ncbi:MAG TPA: alpha/beta hydrolase [Nocardioidaceae bacterium]|nr:alpha/beta hydrolase [Nocardioidaceae bacterium]